MPSLILFGAAFICISAASLLLVPERGGATLPQVPEIASLEPAYSPRDTPSWTRIAHPAVLFTLDAPQLSKTQMSYEALRSPLGQGREDRLVFGSATRQDQPFAEVAILHAGAEDVEGAPFFVDLSRHAAAEGLAVAKAAPSEPLPSKFGEMESAQAKLSTNSVERGCIAFRRAVPGEVLGILGWYCAPEGFDARAPELSCLVERLELSGAIEDNALRDAFAAAQMRRLGCGKPDPKPAPLPVSLSSGKSTAVIATSAASLAPLLAGKPHPARGTKTRHRRIP